MLQNIMALFLFRIFIQVVNSVVFFSSYGAQGFSTLLFAFVYGNHIMLGDRF